VRSEALEAEVARLKRLHAAERAYRVAIQAAWDMGIECNADLHEVVGEAKRRLAVAS
jgi:hypothetical protein